MTSGPVASTLGAGVAATSTHVLHTFVVEDSQVILDNLVATLEEMTSLRVVCHAADETTVLAQLAERSGELDLVIIDLFLKSGSGWG